MEDERWLRAVLDVCRAELEQAEGAGSRPHDDYVVDLKCVIAHLEKRLGASEVHRR